MTRKKRECLLVPYFSPKWAQSVNKETLNDIIAHRKKHLESNAKKRPWNAFAAAEIAWMDSLVRCRQGVDKM